MKNLASAINTCIQHRQFQARHFHQLAIGNLFRSSCIAFCRSPRLCASFVNNSTNRSVLKSSPQGLGPICGVFGIRRGGKSCPDKKLNPNRAVNWVIQWRGLDNSASWLRYGRWRVGKFAVTIAHEISFLAGRQRRRETKKELKCKVYKNKGAEKGPA